MSDRIVLQGKLPIGAIDTRASGWWAMIFVVFTEASLFAYLLFSYFYLAVQPHMAGTFPQGGPPSLMLALPGTIILLASSCRSGLGAIGHRAWQPLAAGSGIGNRRDPGRSLSWWCNILNGRKSRSVFPPRLTVRSITPSPAFTWHMW